MPDKVKCPKCGSDSVDVNGVCQQCGYKVPPVSKTTRHDTNTFIT